MEQKTVWMHLAFLMTNLYKTLKQSSFQSLCPQLVTVYILLRENYVTLVSRVLVKHLKYFSSFTKCVQEHIEHEHSAEMAKKSEIVSITFDCWF